MRRTRAVLNWWRAAAVGQPWAQRMLIAATPYRQRLTSFWNSDAGLVMRFAAIALVFPAIAFVALVVHFKGLADFEAGRSTKPATFQDRWPRAPLATHRPSDPAQTRNTYNVPNSSNEQGPSASAPSFDPKQIALPDF